MGNKANGRKFAKMDNIEYYAVMGAKITGIESKQSYVVGKIPCPYANINSSFPGMERIIQNGKV